MRLKRFIVQNYRNISDSGWIETTDITAFVGQNEAGKSNLFEALYCLNPYVDGAAYNVDEDWPVDNWRGKADATGKVVCAAEFSLEPDEIKSLFDHATSSPDDENEEEGNAKESCSLPVSARLRLTRQYGSDTNFTLVDDAGDTIEAELVEQLVTDWGEKHAQKFVLIHDYNMSGTQVELDQLKQRLDQAGGDPHRLSIDDQTILQVLDLAQIDLAEFIKKGQTPDGRTVRSMDKRAASKYLSQQFGKLWTQKKVNFEIEIDNTTLNIFAEDDAIKMPVRLNRRSTGFRWYASFAWKFTHASEGEYADCVLLLEEPGIHLHYSGQRDLLGVFNNLSSTNSVLYTTHLASMVDQAHPERVRIVETRNNHLAITQGVVSAQPGPMAVIEMSLGLTPDMSGMLGNRKVLIVEGGTDKLILDKLSGILKASGKTGKNDEIYMWTAGTASKTPMYAAFAIGQKWDAGVLLDSDRAGKEAKTKIDELLLREQADEDELNFRVLMLGDAAGVANTDAAVEDLFPDATYLGWVNQAYGLAMDLDDLPDDGSDMITSRVERTLKRKHDRELDKKRVLGVMLRDFDTWSTVTDLPKGTAVAAEKLFKKINAAFGADGKEQ